MPLHQHDAVCGHLGELALRQLLMLDNEHSGRSKVELDDMIHAMWPQTTDGEIEQALRRDLVAIERRTAFRLFPGEGEKVP